MITDESAVIVQQTFSSVGFGGGMIKLNNRKNLCLQFGAYHLEAIEIFQQR